MRVVIASRIFLPEPAAASLRLAAVAEALEARGVDVTVLTSRPPRGLEAADPPGRDVRRARVLRDRDGYVRGYLQYASFDVPLALRLLVARRPDAVLVEPPPTTGFVVRVVCALRRIPYVYYAADVWADAAANATGSRLVLGLLRRLETAAWRGAAAVLSVSPEVTRRLAALGIVGRVHTIGNGADETVFSDEGDVVDLDRPYLVYAGTASEVHGADVFARAFERVHAQNPDARLVFIGQGTDWDAIAEVAARLPAGAVTLSSRIPPEALTRWLRGASAALGSVRPGTGYEFAFPTKLYAAALCGTPVIFAGEGPAVDYLDDPVSGVAVPYDEAAVAAAMLAALAETPSRDRRIAIRAWALNRAAASSSASRAAEVIVETAS